MENQEPFGIQPATQSPSEPPIELIAEPPGADAPKKGIASGANLVLGGLFVAVLAGIYLLHLTSGPKAASAAQQESEKKLATFLVAYKDGRNNSQAGKKTADVVSTIYYDNTKRQVPVEHLTSNPFQFKASQQPVKTAAGPTKSVVSQDIDLDIAMQKARGLKLQSVMSNSRGGGKAIINDTPLTVGKSIDGWKVMKIEPMAVTLKFRKATYVLRLE